MDGVAAPGPTTEHPAELASERAGVLLRPRAAQARVDRCRTTPRGELMAKIRRELHGGRLRWVMRPVVDLGRRRYDHHHDGDSEHEEADGSGERGRRGALRANEGSHFRYPLSQSPLLPAPHR